MCLGLNGPADSQKVHLAFAMLTQNNQRGLFIAHNELWAKKYYDDFAFFAKDQVLFLPHIELVLHDIAAESLDVHYKRMEVMGRILRGDFKVVVTSCEAILRKFISPRRFSSSIIKIKTGEIFNSLDITQNLICLGFERVNVVEGKGQFAIRGGIIDIFPVNYEYPLRIELFGDEVDSIRHFDLENQRSLGNVNDITIIPIRELIYFTNERNEIVSKIEKELETILKKKNKDNNSAIERLNARVNTDIERFHNSYYFPGMDKYIDAFPEHNYSIIDYLPKGTAIFVEESQQAITKIDTCLFEHYDNCRGMMEKGFILPSANNILFEKENIAKMIMSGKSVILNTLGFSKEPLVPDREFRIGSKPLTAYNGRLDIFFDDLRLNLKKGKRIVVLCGPKAKCEHFIKLLNEQEIPVKYFESEDFTPNKNVVSITHGSLYQGFEYIENDLMIVADKELFGEDKKVSKNRFKDKNSKKINVFAEIEPGDYVVHYAHGIGQFLGIEKLEVGGAKSDYLKIRFVEGDFLYVPVTQLELVQKYIGGGEKLPKLNRLGSGDWSKAKARVKESLREIASELIKIYAQREMAKGHKFSKDTVWQKQMEELFPYDETRDQIKSIEEIKRDMESEKPMDRLLCGDVGFGKTEVALRAMFKAVMDGKQVAYLVPTTVLAHQHYSNFKERFRDFPITIDMLSRFKTPKEQSQILKDMKKGMVDIIVGTHRIVQKDINFKNLGLLVVDEEQRFGVTHKEQLKKITTNVDVLTLTATPIPRTLHMSLAGIRDISILEEPPHDRHPVQTYVIEYNEDIIKEAIEREISRDGQVFYLFNTVRTIELKREELLRVVPSARVEIAHGQMNKNRLEEVMQDFLEKKFDVLLCSTIIESGLDFPNVNTIIVEESDKMGLSQLYQIRGRVGRSNRIAYAYLTFKRDKVLNEVAEKRLAAIREFTELGSGFKIAMRDLEIRGAGNLLGSQQHGHMDTVGYDMYMRLLNEAVVELRGELKESFEEVEINVDFSINAFISPEYIVDEVLRLNMYKKIAAIDDLEDYEDLVDEFIDRFGDIPEETKNLIDISLIRAISRGVSIELISQKNDRITIQFFEGTKIDFKILSVIMDKNKKRLLFSASNKPYLTFNVSGLTKGEMLQNVKFLLQDLKNIQKEIELDYN
jgi:transcription-repair coupling factor (superfamily II helicase)